VRQQASGGAGTSDTLSMEEAFIGIVERSRGDETGHPGTGTAP